MFGRTLLASAIERSIGPEILLRDYDSLWCLLRGLYVRSRTTSSDFIALGVCNEPWQGKGTPSQRKVNANVLQLSRWIAVEVMSMCLEIGIAAFPMYLVRGLQIGNAAKLRVVVWYWVRLV